MNTIVVGYDNSAVAQTALEWATAHAQRIAGELLVIYVASSIAEWSSPRRRSIPIRFGTSSSVVFAASGPRRVVRRRFPTARSSLSDSVAEELIRTAREEHAALIVIGMTARGGHQACMITAQQADASCVPRAQFDQIDLRSARWSRARPL